MALNSSNGDVLNTTDVYDFAAALRQEFERLITSHGPEPFKRLIHPVVQVLELLETLCDARQKERNELDELRFVVERLRADEVARVKHKENYEKDLEMLEQRWKSEMQELADYTAKLREENTKLHTMLNEKLTVDHAVQSDVESAAELTDQLKMLRETVQQQNDRIRVLHRQIDDKNDCMQAMQLQIDRLLKLNSECWQRTSLSQRHIDHQLQQVIDLQLSVKDKEQQISRLKAQLAQVNLRIHEVDEMQHCCTVASETSVSEGDGSGQPHFSLEELKTVLHQRNQLKMQLYEAEEQLERLMAADREPSSPAVEGPINREPDEKLHPELHKHRSSTIRRIFHRFLNN